MEKGKENESNEGQECEHQQICRFIAKVQAEPSKVSDFHYLNYDQPGVDKTDNLFKELYVSPRQTGGGNPVAEWRLRVAKQIAIDNRLTDLGPLALICAGNLLTASQDSNVIRVERFSSSKETMRASRLFHQQTINGKHNIIGAKYPEYVRIEQAIQSFGQMLCLSVSNLRDKKIIEAFNLLKVWCVNYAFKSMEYMDEVIAYIKWLAKAAQSVQLKAEVPEEPILRPERFDGQIIPYVGELSYLSGFIQAGKRERGLTSHEARALAQQANTSRALPYPSHNQAKESIEKTVEIFTTKKEPNPAAFKLYKHGLDIVEKTIPKPSSNRTHMSQINKGTVECSRANGGRSAYLVACCRLTTNIPQIEEHKSQIGLYDQYGNEYISRTTWEVSKVLLSSNEYQKPPNLGDILFMEPDKLAQQWDYALNKGKQVPQHLAELLNATAAKQVLKIGHYNPSHTIIHGLITFKVQKVIFSLTDPIRVKADVSIEAGMKTRLITASLAAFAHLSQAPSNYMRSYLSADPFCRVGFEEADKLWEVLKQYHKEFLERDSKKKN